MLTFLGLDNTVVYSAYVIQTFPVYHFVAEIYVVSERTSDWTAVELNMSALNNRLETVSLLRLISVILSEVCLLRLSIKRVISQMITKFCRRQRRS